jgi:hypothetical protein
MERLAGDINKAVGSEKPGGVLEQAALNWAGFSLQTFKGKRLKKALNISRAIINFVNLNEDDSKQE